MSALPDFTKRLEARIALALAKAEAALAGILSLSHHTAATNALVIGPAGTISFSTLAFTPRTGKVRLTAYAFVSAGTMVVGDTVGGTLLRDGAQIPGAPIAFAASLAGANVANIFVEWEDTVTPNTSHTWGLQCNIANGSGHTIEFAIGGGIAGGAVGLILEELAG